MSITIKNTMISLTLSAGMLLVAYASGQAPNAHLQKAAICDVQNKNQAIAPETATRKKTRNSFAAPYFSFGKPNLPTGVR